MIRFHASKFKKLKEVYEERSLSHPVPSLLVLLPHLEVPEVGLLPGILDV